MSLIVFGEPLPVGDNEDFFVSYKVEGFPGGMLSGPYVSGLIAIEELKDVMRYEGVKDAVIVQRHELILGDRNEQVA